MTRDWSGHLTREPLQGEIVCRHTQWRMRLTGTYDRPNIQITALFDSPLMDEAEIPPWLPEIDIARRGYNGVWSGTLRPDATGYSGAIADQCGSVIKLAGVSTGNGVLELSGYVSDGVRP